MRYRRRQFTIIGMSYGFVVATRMIQRYPELAKQVDFVVSVVGFARHDDFKIAPTTFFLMKLGARIFKGRIASLVAKVLINGKTVDATYTLMANRHAKMKNADLAERRKRIEFEKILWRINDLRTWFFINDAIFNLDLCDMYCIDCSSLD